MGKAYSVPFVGSYALKEREDAFMILLHVLLLTDNPLSPLNKELTFDLTTSFFFFLVKLIKGRRKFI